MRRETELFFSSIVREDHDVTDLLTADYTYVDELLAKHFTGFLTFWAAASAAWELPTPTDTGCWAKPES